MSNDWLHARDGTPRAVVEPIITDHSEEISRLFREHNATLVSFLAARLRDEAEAKEVAQEAYVRLLQLDAPVTASFLRWNLFKIAKGIAVDRHRRRLTRDRLDQLREPCQLEVTESAESGAIAADELSSVLAALRELPSKCRQAFLLRRFHNLSNEEVGVRLGITDRMVRKHVHRALSYCRYRLDGMSREDALERLKS